MKKILVMVGILMMLGACNSANTYHTTRTDKIVRIEDVSNTDYLLTTVFPNKGITLGFNTDKRVFGYTGLNRYFGKVAINGDFIVMDSISTTKMSGTQDQFITENLYLTMLKSMRKIEVKNGKIILSNPKGETLEFTPVSGHINY